MLSYILSFAVPGSVIVQIDGYTYPETEE